MPLMRRCMRICSASYRSAVGDDLLEVGVAVAVLARTGTSRCLPLMSLR